MMGQAVRPEVEVTVEVVLTPPRVLPEAVGRVYLLAPEATPSSFVLSAADMSPAADWVAAE